MKVLRLWVRIASSFLVLMIAACGPESGKGILSLSLSDATTEEYNAVYATIKEVQVHKDGDEDSG